MVSLSLRLRVFPFVMLRIKVKSSEGEKVMNMNQDSTFYTLLQELGLENANFKAGFPVKSLNYSRDDLIKDYLKNGDSVLMEDCVKQFKELNPSEMPGYPQRGTLVNGDAIQTFEGILVVRPIKDDNSCLFRCIAQIMLNDNSDNVSRLRQVVVDNIRSHPELYSEAILGRPIDEYCDWILKPNSWGGAIEIGIFSNQFKTSIFACDATSGNIIRFGDYPNGCFVMYSGIHYEY